MKKEYIDNLKKMEKQINKTKSKTFISKAKNVKSKAKEFVKFAQRNLPKKSIKRKGLNKVSPSVKLGSALHIKKGWY